MFCWLDGWQVAVSRAKQQLKSAMMMNLESRAIIFEDIGRCVCTSVCIINTQCTAIHDTHTHMHTKQAGVRALWKEVLSARTL